MLYFTIEGGQHVLVLEPQHLKFLKAGESLKSPDGAVMIVYTNDSAWLGEQLIANMDNLTPALIDKLIGESQQRPEKPVGPYYPPIHVIQDGKLPKSD